MDKDTTIAVAVSTTAIVVGAVLILFLIMRCKPDALKLVTSCPTMEYTGTDIANPSNMELTCTDMIRAFGPELASLSSIEDTSKMTCKDFEDVMNTDTVKALLHRDSIPDNFCSPSCCDISAYQDVPLACIVFDENNENLCKGRNMCVHGIDENNYRCDLGRAFTNSEEGLVDSWTGGVYKGELYGEGSFEDAGTICCTEQIKAGLE